MAGVFARAAAMVATAVLAVLSAAAPSANAILDNVITDWNYVLQQIVRSNGINSQIASRYFALLHLAQYKAVKGSVGKEPDTNQEFIAASAAHFVLSESFPVLQSRFVDANLKKYALKGGISVPETQRLQALARSYSVPILAARAYDGTQNWAYFTPGPVNGTVGLYQFTPGQTFAVYPQLGTSKPFVVPNAHKFDTLGGPLTIGTATYRGQLREVIANGNATSTQSNKDTANFWADGATTAAVPGHIFNVSVAVLPASLTILETAKVFALQGTASFDSAVATWFQKFKYQFWRPITAIRQGDGQVAPVPSFTPFLATPTHPEYPSGHSSATGAQIGIIAKVLGIEVTDPLSVTVGTEFPGLAPRTYTSLLQLAKEVGVSRIYGGILFRKSINDGLTIGLRVSRYVWGNFDKIH